MSHTDDPDHDPEDCLGCKVLDKKPYHTLAKNLENVAYTFLKQTDDIGQDIGQEHFLAMTIGFVEMLRTEFEVPPEAIFDMVLLVLRTEDENFIKKRLIAQARGNPKLKALLKAVAEHEEQEQETIH